MNFDGYKILDDYIIEPITINKKYYLYNIVNKLSDKYYVGVTCNPDGRWYHHKLIARSGLEKFPKHFHAIHAAIVKYGVDNFEFKIIKIFDIEDNAYLAEIESISYANLNKIKIYNKSPGGKGTGSGKDHPNFGRKSSKKTRQKISEAMKGRVFF